MKSNQASLRAREVSVVRDIFRAVLEQNYRKAEGIAEAASQARYRGFDSHHPLTLIEHRLRFCKAEAQPSAFL
jgi:hypothetical protein